MSNETVPDDPVETPENKELNYDLILMVTFMGVVSISFLWSVSAGGFYRQPASAESLPSPVYIGAEELHQVPAPVPVSIEVTEEANLEFASVPMSLPVPAPSAQPRIVASEYTEEALGLKRAARVAVQQRLALAGFDPNGVDGVFGQRTRAAIAGYQTAWGFPATGYLEPAVYADLKQRTEDAYQALGRQGAAAPSAAPDLAPAADERPIADANREGGCARHSNGRIIERQSLACDIAGLGESFASFGGTTSESGEDTGPDR